MSMREARARGASSVMMAMRYMWSEIDSPWFMPKRRQPSRFVVFRRVRRWKKGTGEVVCDTGWKGAGMVERTVEGVHCVDDVVLWFRRPEVGSV